MKPIYLILSLLVCVYTYSQVTTIYTEDFSNDWKRGAITYGGITPAQPSDGNWSWVNVGSPDNDGGSAGTWNDMAFIDGAAVMSSTGSTASTLSFRWNDVNDGSTSNRVDWYSKSITGAYTTITASLAYAIGNGSSANSVWSYYKIDGGAWTLFGSSINQSTASGTFTSSTLSCNTSIQLLVTALTRNNNSAYVTIDNIQITAQAVVVSLPINLLYFKGLAGDRQNNLYWTTASELNNNYYTIYYMNNANLVWTDIAKVAGVGTSLFTTKYNIVVPYDYLGINYYMLEQTDFDGKQKTYNDLIISIDNTPNATKLISRITNALGQDIDDSYKGIIFIIFSDGSSIIQYRE